MKFKTIKEFLDAHKQGKIGDGIVLWLDNDSCHVTDENIPDDEGEPMIIYNGDEGFGNGLMAYAALESLGVKCEQV